MAEKESDPEEREGMLDEAMEEIGKDSSHPRFVKNRKIKTVYQWGGRC